MKWLLLCCMFLCTVLHAQTDELAQAHMYADTKDYDKAITLYKKLYRQQPQQVYDDYLSTLLAAKEYKDAEKLVNERLHTEATNPLLYINLGSVYEAAGKDKKANEQYLNALHFVNGDELVTQRMANAYSTLGKDKYAIQVYERASQLIGNDMLYSALLARLYAKTGEWDKAVNVLIGNGPTQFSNTDNIKATLLELLGNDPKKLQIAQKALLKNINAQPDNPYFVELLTWLYTQKDDWEGALIQIEALDARNREDGHRLLNFAHTAAFEHKYDIAIKAYTEVVDKGNTQPLYALAKAERLAAGFAQLQDNPDYTKDNVATLIEQYKAFFTEFPQYYATHAAADYAKLEAQYNNDPQEGIRILQAALTEPNIDKSLAGTLKLQLGDYYILVGKVWDASLMYSQVDKAFRNDAMGEEARYRNGRLAYYRGDFEWAQGQLTVLKSATSELIANDAMYLSILMTENITPDSNYIPLRRFAYADLLLFQNKDAEAEKLLDSIATAFPDHPLRDDILMLDARIAEKHRDYTKAIAFLKQIYEQYGKDVLGDDAVYNMAEIYRKNLHQPEQAKHYYEELITVYPGSTYIQSARKNLAELSNPTLP